MIVHSSGKTVQIIKAFNNYDTSNIENQSDDSEDIEKFHTIFNFIHSQLNNLVSFFQVMYLS